MNLDMIPRYVPQQVYTRKGYRPVIQIIAHPPGLHPKECPLLSDVTALELITDVYPRWYGCEKAYINSELRMIAIGFPELFEEMRAWAKVPADKTDGQ